jgi:hypothetical protein
MLFAIGKFLSMTEMITCWQRDLIWDKDENYEHWHVPLLFRRVGE